MLDNMDIKYQIAQGVWAVVDSDYHDTITMVYLEEIEALRAINERGYGKVKFVPWGKSLVDLDQEK